MEDKPIRAAATVVLARDGAEGMEVCLLRRSSKSSFMASVIVYPGGAVDPEDYTLATSERVHASRALWHTPESRAHAIAALREAFEESGLLAASFKAPPRQERLDELRLGLRSDAITFQEVLRALDANLVLDELWFFDRWVTPPWETKRYDTWFFLTRAPEGQRLYSDGVEVTDERWMTPQNALERYHARELLLAPPTWATIKDLANFTRVDDAMAYAAAAKPYAICPHFMPLQEQGTGVILLPGDPGYPGFEGVDTQLRGTPIRTRIAMRDGLWFEYVEDFVSE